MFKGAPGLKAATDPKAGDQYGDLAGLLWKSDE
jgi:hypothetical protein